MKKYLIAVLSLVIMCSLTACSFELPWNKQEEPEVFQPTQVTVVGTVKNIGVTDILVETDTFEESTIMFEAIPEDIHEGTQATFNVNTREFDEYYDIVDYSIILQPLRWILGYTGEELVSTPMNYNSMLITVKEAIGGDATYKGRLTSYSWTRTNVLRNDIYTRQTSTITSSKLDDITASDVVESYVTKTDDITRYFNANYTGWYYDAVDEFVMQPNLIFNPDTVTVTSYEMENGINVAVGFDWDYKKDTNILSSYIKDTMDKFKANSDEQVMHVLAIYNSETKDLQKLTVTGEAFGADAVVDDLPLMIASYQLSVYGIEYNTINELPVPATVLESAIDSYYIENPLPEVPNFIKEELLCKSLMGKDQVLIDDIKEWAHLDDNICMYRWGMHSDELCAAIKNWVNNYTTDSFMNAYVYLTYDNSNEDITSANIIYTWLVPYDIKVSDYAPAPTE